MGESGEIGDSAPFAPREIAFNLTEALGIAEIIDLGARCLRTAGRDLLAGRAAVVLAIVEGRLESKNQEDG